MAEKTAKSLAGEVSLRDVTQADLEVFFAHQLDAAANDMAAFTAKDPTDKAAFGAHWTRILGDEAIVKKTIIVGGKVIGHISSFEQFGKPEISYWLGKAFWGRGFATAALSKFLEQVNVRPLYARAAKDNLASIRILQKCGFVISGEDRGFANARGREIEELILSLGSGESRV